MQHNRIGSHHQRDQVHVTSYTNVLDEHTEQPHKCGTPRAPRLQRGLPSRREDPLCLQVGIPPETAQVLARCQLPVQVERASADGGQAELFVFYHVNEMLNPENLYIRLHKIMDGMPWCSYYHEHHSKEDREVYFRDHVNIIQGLEHLRDWLKNRYLAEARETWHNLKIHSGDIDHLPYP